MAHHGAGQSSKYPCHTGRTKSNMGRSGFLGTSLDHTKQDCGAVPARNAAVDDQTDTYVTVPPLPRLTPTSSVIRGDKIGLPAKKTAPYTTQPTTAHLAHDQPRHTRQHNQLYKAPYLALHDTTRHSAPRTHQKRRCPAPLTGHRAPQHAITSERVSSR